MNKKMMVVAVCVVLAVAGAGWSWMHRSKEGVEDRKLVTVTYGSIEHVVAATGNVQPQNRLEIKPPIAGRIDKILVVEGQKVKAGEMLVLLSSTERASLLDAALVQGPEKVKEWEDVYKPTTLIAPIDGQVIVKSVNPGQVVTQSDPVVVLSDRLIVQAQIDETDIGKVKVGQKAGISMDAYPELSVKGVVDHIYYESKIVNNVTIYNVDIVPDDAPEVFRSGMSANVQIIQDRKDHVLIAAREAVKKKGGASFVLLLRDGERKPRHQEVETGIADDNNIELVSGVREGDQLVVPSGKYVPSRGGAAKTSPFMPGGGRGGGNRGR